MATFECKELDLLIKQFAELEKKVQKKVLSEIESDTSTMILDDVKSEAQKLAAKENSTRGYAFMDKDVILRPTELQSKFGITSSNWEMTKQYWYHYWGFSHLKRKKKGTRTRINVRPTFHDSDPWLDKAYDKAMPKAEDKVKEHLVKVFKEGLK